MRSFLRYMILEFTPLLLAALIFVVCGWSWLTGQTISQTMFIYAGNL